MLTCSTAESEDARAWHEGTIVEGSQLLKIAHEEAEATLAAANSIKLPIESEATRGLPDDGQI